MVLGRDHVPSRVAVAGVSGSGRTTLAGRIGARLGLPHTEIDGLFHGPGWTPRPEFTDDVRTMIAEPACARREVLWNGNVEPPLRSIFTRGDENIINWAWSTRDSLARLDEILGVDAPHVTLVRLRSRRAVEEWLVRLTQVR